MVVFETPNMDNVMMNGYSNSCKYTYIPQTRQSVPLHKSSTPTDFTEEEDEKRNECVTPLKLDYEKENQKYCRKMSLKKYPATQEQEKIVCVLLAIFNFVFIVLISILATIIHNESTDPEAVTDFCLSRTLIEGHPYDRDVPTSCSATHCCFQNLNSTGEIIQKMTSRWLKEKILNDKERSFARYNCTEQDKSVKGGTIKLLAPRDRERRSVVNNCVLWECQANKTILPNEKYFKFHREKGYIEIKIPGMYHVYSQVNIYYGGNVLQNYFHCVISKNNIGSVNERLLMRSSNSQCSCKNSTQLFSSYLGSDFYLHEGEKLAVKVHEDSIHSMESDSNLFGILKL